MKHLLLGLKTQKRNFIKEADEARKYIETFQNFSKLFKTLQIQQKSDLYSNSRT
jgi:hypothetical protein